MKPNTGPLAHVRAWLTRVCGRRVPGVRVHVRTMDRVEYERRLYACVARAEAEARAQDALLSVRAR